MKSVIHYMGWLRLVGSLQFQVSFAKYRLFYRALLQKRHIILRSLLIVATPYARDMVGYGHVTSAVLTSLFCVESYTNTALLQMRPRDLRDGTWHRHE